MTEPLKYSDEFVAELKRYFPNDLKAMATAVATLDSVTIGSLISTAREEVRYKFEDCKDDTEKEKLEDLSNELKNLHVKWREESKGMQASPYIIRN